MDTLFISVLLLAIVAAFSAVLAPRGDGNLLDRAKLDAAYIGFSTVFQDALELAPNLWQNLATRVDSAREQEQYKWIGENPKMKEWVGDRTISKLRAQTYTIENKDFANAIEVDRNDIMDDNLGIVRPRIAGLGMAARQHYDELIFDLILNGFDATFGLAYDGQFFFDTDHADEPGQTPQSNTTGAALSDTEFNDAYQEMTEFETSEGEPLNIDPNLLLVGPSNRVSAREIVREKTTGGEDNVNAGIVDVMVAPRIKGTFTAHWFLLDTGKPLRPWILQIRQALQLVALDSMDDFFAFMRKVFMFGVDGRHNAGFGLWQCAFGSNA